MGWGRLLAAIAVCNLAYWLALLLAARFYGIRVREHCVGIGPVLFGNGKLQLRLLPISAWVRMALLADRRPEEAERVCLDAKAVPIQLIVAASGCVALLWLGACLNEGASLDSFRAGWSQLPFGALPPWGEAQHWLAALSDWTAQSGFLAMLPVVAAKMAVFNLLPLPGAAGGIMLRLLVPMGARPAFEHSNVFRLWMAAHLLWLFCWLAALALHVWPFG
ncbi:hypothetical protein KIF53_20990 [Chromobacterium subtsugae]|uniref:Peptidase M50 domain-containing protein n=1 Tax=Chromobacterium subtsugae TaxID=251747 RepID=A0ABS7FJ83_9NEIS|nr:MULTISPECIES: hypothetical protein [Chromobacterium]MBW7568493.1 hypothetical protein [Chromobacterium subtsugae]MBW8290122.1 hypothetical protein [Chromobacterium subtsugae]WSE89588.1 hypothetical protein U6115_11890 [Chromobacterium subtsugae]WVH57959.1 hypothetical protein U6151_11910 [Chromobacterium subtsugae]